MSSMRARRWVVPVFAVIFVSSAWGCGGGGDGGKSPRIVGIIPPAGPLAGGMVVTIDTTAFRDDFSVSPPTSVTFGGAAGTLITGLDPDSVQVTTPPAPLQGAVDVTVAAAGGQTATIVGGYMYRPVVNCSIVDIAPAGGPLGGGTIVTIDGSDFGPIPPDPTVLFGAIPATILGIPTETTVQVETPGQPIEGPVDVTISTSGNGTCTRVSGFTYGPPVGPACNFTGIAPATGDVGGGFPVTITGTDFHPTSNLVLFDGVPALSPQTDGPTSITTTVPPGSVIGTVDVEVIPRSGTPCILSGSFTYTGCLFTICSSSGLAVGGNTVQIDGTNFEPNTVEVYFGTEIVPAGDYLLRDSATQIVCRVPPEPAGTPRFVDVRIENRVAGTSCTVADAYEYRGCVGGSIHPNTGATVGGTAVTICGSGFVQGGMEVLFGPTLALNIDVLNETTILCNTPASITSGQVAVEVRGGDGRVCSIPGGFTYDTPVAPGACTITSVFPPEGPPSGGFPVTITGSGFEETPRPAVLFGRIQVSPSAVTWQDSSTIVVDPIPGTWPGGAVDVAVVNGSGGSCVLPAGFSYTILPCIFCDLDPFTPMTPDPVTQPLDVAGEATPRQIHVTGFCSGPATVLFTQECGGAPVTVIAPSTIVSPNQVDVVIPPAPIGPGLVSIRVEDGGMPCGTFLGIYQ